MRLPLFAVLLLVPLGGCPRGDGDCTVDDDCGGNSVCTRNSECLEPSDVHAVRITWTIRGQVANATNCTPTPDFYLLFTGTQLNDTFGYQPVPCMAGLFTIDKMPKRFYAVEIGVDGRFAESAQFDATGNAAFDLTP